MDPKNLTLVGGSLLQTANEKEGWDTDKSYSQVKLLGMAVMLAVATRMTMTAAAVTGAAEEEGPPPPRVNVNAVCPDLCQTYLGRNWDGFLSHGLW
ncbi:hypothetical protein PG994_005279 [Apiospora phragmitis]|uniref:Uncharacterized protein n=1 Tax=Apiospora phragmitis TaxID=2905665 RepID=A0ABR1VBV7_9PEZI